jgi:acylphosphatase
MKSRAHLIIRGRVQGVGFRWFVYDTAVSLRLSGWVKNLYDGQVEAVLEGERSTIETAIKQCSDGPRSAVVSGIDLNWDENPEGLTGFDIRH